MALGLIENIPAEPVPRIPAHVGAVIKPVFEALSSDAILSRCQRAQTQNANESFNNLIWLRCPKEQWTSKSSVFVATALATLKFNKGAAGVFDLFVGDPSDRQDVKAGARNRRRLIAGSAEKLKRKTEKKYTKRRKTTGEEVYGAGIEDSAGNL